MHKRLNALIISGIMASSLFFTYSVSAQTPDNSGSHEKQIVQVDTEDKLGMLEGHLGDLKSKDINGVAEFFKENTDLFQIQNPKSELKLKTTKTDELGNTHIKVQQILDGIDIYGKEYIIHVNKEGCVYLVNGILDPDISKKYTSSKSSSKISKTKAIEIAKKTVNVDKTVTEPEATQYIYNLDGEYMPVYQVNLSAVKPTVANWIIYVNLETGDVVDKVNHIDTIAEQGEGIGTLGDNKSLNLDFSNGQYSMTDKTKEGVTIQTFDASDIKVDPDYVDPYLPGKLYTKSTNKFNDENEKSAVDAHAYARNVYDYYKNNFNRNSIDDKGMPIKSTVHIGDHWLNAAWNGSQMIYGDGDGVQFKPFSAGLDVIAHEITHGVDSFECDLDYTYQYGALNESFSDVFGTLVEFEYQKDKANYLIGEDLMGPSLKGKALRDMENPDGPKAIRPQPAHMKDFKSKPKSDDRGGVHTNSGIPNKAACIIIKTIGTEKTSKIYYDALRNNMTKYTDFHKARLALLKSAQKFYGKNSVEYNTVIKAFDTVGIK